MAKSKDTKRAFLGSVLSMIICLSMLIGSTFAWFSDSVVSGTNKIVAGNLDVELWHQNANKTILEEVIDETPLFVKNDGTQINWEPGVMVYENFTVKNVGSLALKYKLKVNVGEYNTVTVNENGTEVEKSLKEVLKVAILENQHFSGDREDALALQDQFTGTVESFEKIDTLNAGTVGTTGKDYAMIIYWLPSDKDNEYNINNGKTVTDPIDGKQELYINLGVSLEATQHTVENDSFNDQYDKNAWNDMLYKDKHDGTYSDSDGNLYVKEEENYVPVIASNETEGLYLAENGDKYVTTMDAFAIEALKGGNVTVLEDIDKKFTNNSDNTKVLMLNNENTETNVNLSNKNLSIQSVSGKNGISVNNGVIANFSNGIITMDNSWGDSYPLAKINDSNATFDNMTLTMTSQQGYCLTVSGSGETIINNSTINGTANGTYYAAIYAASLSTVKIYNSTVVGRIRAGNNSLVELHGGDYTNTIFKTEHKSNVVIYSGTFNHDPRNDSNGCTIASESSISENNGIWTVTENQ